MKRLMSILLCFALLCGFGITTHAESVDNLLDVLEYEVLSDDTIKITRYDSTSPTFDIPSEIDGKIVTVIGKKAFKECHLLTNVTVPDSVTTIENYAFDSCKKLKTVTLGNSVKSLGFRAFGDCKALTAINLPQGLETIGNNCFIRCFALDNIIVPQTVTTIGNYAFSDCTGITSLTFEDGEFTIGEYAFGWCLKLTDITLGANVKEIKQDAFCACDSIKNITIENKDCVISDSINTLPDNATITAHSGSTAESYATKYTRTFTAIAPPFEVLRGDADLDGIITVLDATLIQKHLAADAQLSENALKNADADSDSSVTILDATHIQRFLAQIIESL